MDSAPKEKGMEQQLPSWLADAIAAAGMTAYADDLDRRLNKTRSSTPAEPTLDESTPPVH